MNAVIQRLSSAASMPKVGDMTDGQLVERFVNRRDASALELLVRRHGGMVWGVCQRILRDHHDAEDAFQATFLVLARKAASVHPRSQVGNWLYGVAHQTALKARATSAKRRSRERHQSEMPEPSVTTRDIWPDLQQVLDKELSLLPDAYREVIVLCDLEGKTRLEAARCLGCPEGTVGSRLARARMKLAKRLSRLGLVVSGGAIGAMLCSKTARAAVPGPVLTVTIKALTELASGSKSAASLITPQAAALTEGVTKAMLICKLKTLSAVTFMLFAIGFGGSAFYSHQVAAADEPPESGLSPTPQKRQIQEDRKANSSGKSNSFVGSWNTSFGPMTLSKKGDKLTGSYEMSGQHCLIEGRVRGRKFTFTYREPGAEGEGWFELSKDGNSFAGKWRESNQENWLDWQGQRKGVVERFVGDWRTKYGPMKLAVNGSRLSGSYKMSGQHCDIEGTVEGKRFTFRYREPNAVGEGWFEISDDGNSFSGNWRADGDSDWSEWTGDRVRIERGFAGDWETTYGRMTLSQTGADVAGFYIMNGERCEIVGVVDGNRFSFTYREPHAKGEGWFELSKNSRSFTGKWRVAEGGGWNDWTGKRIESAFGFVGTWKSTYGAMTLTLDGNKVSGSYEMDGKHCLIEGSVSGNRLEFTYQEPNARGEGWFELSINGQSFSGKWRVDGSDVWRDWTGERQGARKSFAGDWETTFGPMTLALKGEVISGTYEMGNQQCQIAGRLESNRFKFEYREPNAHGEGWFEISSDGKSFTGKWREIGDDNWHDWAGTRK
jgi:RNA polymerase sigma factor (sigma-70 family)